MSSEEGARTPAAVGTTLDFRYSDGLKPVSIYRITAIALVSLSTFHSLHCSFAFPPSFLLVFGFRGPVAFAFILDVAISRLLFP
eukprot:scaffold5972_cov25-Tisochrysis_lutea.AAC.1